MIGDWWMVPDESSPTLRTGSFLSRRIYANKLSEQLYMNNIKSVYHGEHGMGTLKELARSYLTISKDLTRFILAQETLPVSRQIGG